ncbi:MAG: TonB-dependent receptor [Bacteroidota bacterium]
MKQLFSFIILQFFILNLTFTQSIKGIITDQRDEPLIGVNLYLKNTPSNGTTSDEEGNFEFSWLENQVKDSLVVSYTGYQKLSFALQDLEGMNYFPIQLVEENLALKAFAVVAKRSIAEEFSVQQLKRLDIYRNPIAAADPLRAITALPASTNTDESANPTLRGSNAARTRVILNGVPVYKPVRNSQINGLGNFSLFNTELINNQTVYASNPPLIYANASGGLVEIETQDKLAANSTQVALSLANVGLMTSRKLPSEGLLQIYGNYQFSNPFLKFNERSLEFLKNFDTKDIGVHFRQQLGEQTSLKILSYAIDESYQAEVNQLAFESRANGSKQRVFNTLKLEHQKDHHFLTFNHGNNFSKAQYQFGNIDTEQKERQFYFAGNHKYYFSEQFSLQSGITYDNNFIDFQEQSPIYYFALQENAPILTQDSSLQLNDWQYYSYAKWNINKNLLAGGGIRGNLSGTNFFSYQGSLRYQWKPQHSFLLAGGKYYNYNIPNYLNQNFTLLSSQQWAVEYAHQSLQWEVQFALFQKQETGDVLNYDRQSSNARNLFGVESWIRFRPQQNWTFSLANTYLNAEMETSGGTFRGRNDLNYFLKASVQYDNLAIGSFSLFYLQRPGTFFTPILGSNWNETAMAYEPIFQGTWNGEQLNTYRSLNLAISKVLVFDRHSFVCFLNLANALNTDNQQYRSYNEDYSQFSYETFSKRVLYFGMVWNMASQ